MNATTRALLVLVLDARICDWLAANDPKALEQALVALKSDPAVPKEQKSLVTHLSGALERRLGPGRVFRVEADGKQGRPVSKGWSRADFLRRHREPL